LKASPKTRTLIQLEGCVSLEREPHV